MLVSTVTAISNGASLPNGSSASRAAVIIRAPPEAWTFTIHTPSSAAASHRAGGGVGNIVKLKVQEHLKPTLMQIADKLRAQQG